MTGAVWVFTFITFLLVPHAGLAADNSTNVKQPVILLFDPTVRKRELAAMPPERREFLCGPEPEKWRSHKAVTTIKPPKGYGTDPRTEPFAMSIMQMTARSFGMDDATARGKLLGLLNRWAKGRAMTRIKRYRISGRYSVHRTLLPVIVSYWLAVHDDPEMTKRKVRIEKWLNKLIKKAQQAREKADPNDLSTHNNHALLFAAAMAAWAAFTDQADLLDQSLTIAKQTIDGMRPDGSLPLETQRGARALWYQRHAIASLVVIAEIAAWRSHDLYGYGSGGRSIHQAVRFLIDAINDADMVKEYAKTNLNPGPFQDPTIQDLGFMRKRGHGRHYLSWFDIYQRRFPDRTETQELEALLHQFSNNPRPMVDEYSGGNTTCLFGKDVPVAR